MNLPPDFQFSQSSLQDYDDCNRRFELRYLLRQAWPAVEVEPILEKENFLRQGAAFHRMVHQHLIGLPAEKRIRDEGDDNLKTWWQNFLAAGLDNLPEKRYPEMLLSIKLAGFPLVSRYDLIAVEPGKRAVIVDWKTSRKRPPRSRLENRLQTRVYRYVLVRAGAGLNNGTPFTPEQVEMRYWFTNFPRDPEILPYSAAQFHDDEAYLSRLVDAIKQQTDFPLTDDVKKCRFCMYRSLCERGERAGTLAEEDFFMLEDDADFSEPPITELEF